MFFVFLLVTLSACSGEKQFFHTQADRRAAEIGNMNNGGFAIEDESGNIYYITTSEDSGYQLCGPHSAIGKEENFLGEDNIFTLFLKRQDWIYYLKRDPCCLFRFNVQTKEAEMIFDAFVREMIEFDGKFYCVANPKGSLWVLDMDESGNCTEELLIEEDVRHLVINGEDLYYTAGETLYCNPRNPYPIAYGMIELYIYAINGVFYFVDQSDQGLYKIENGTILETGPFNPRIWSMNVANDKLIYVGPDDFGYLRTFIYNPATEKIEKTFPKGYGDVFLASRYIYERCLSDGGVFIRYVGKIKD